MILTLLPEQSGQIPVDSYKEVERFIADHPEKGYSGVTEFFKEALRKH